jgi:hypothetical protein
VDGQRNDPANFPLTKGPQIPIEHEAEWAPYPVRTLWRGDTSTAMLEIEPRFLDRSNPSLVAPKYAVSTTTMKITITIIIIISLEDSKRF